MVRLSDGQTTAFNDLTDLRGMTIDGLQFDLKNDGQAGQSVLFSPVASAAHDIQSMVHSGNDLAVANPVSAKINSLGDAAIRMSSLKVEKGFDAGAFLRALPCRLLPTGPVA